MLRRLRSIRKQNGFTFIELSLVIAITGLIGTAIAGAVFQIINVNAQTGNHLIAVKQVENVTYWVSHDVQMAQAIQPVGGTGFPLTLSWVEWNNTSHEVSYTLYDTQLRRTDSVNGGGGNYKVVAENVNIDPDKTNCQYASGVFTLKVTASVEGLRPASETRIIKVMPRSAQ